jgi:cytochrome c oxidase cbb3-type subunit 3
MMDFLRHKLWLGLVVGVVGLGAGQPSLADSGGPDRQSGAELYAAHCAKCHGDSGQGALGPPLNLPDFLRVADRDYLTATMRHGRPGRVMPSFRYVLSAGQRRRIAAFIQSWQQAPDYPRPTVGEGDAQRGAKLFQKHCAQCHGYKGQGGEQPQGGKQSRDQGGSGEVVAPALNNSGFLAAASDSFIKATLQHGRSGTRMPKAGGGQLSDQQLDDLVAFMRSWQSEVDPLAQPVVEVRSDLPVAELIPLLKMSIRSHNFAFIRQTTLDEGLAEVGEKVHILHFCSFGLLDKALRTDERVGSFLPCKIAVYREGEQTVMSAINPKALSPLFGRKDLELYCSTVSERYMEIMREANF